MASRFFEPLRKEDAGLARGANPRTTNENGSKKIKSGMHKKFRYGLYVHKDRSEMYATTEFKEEARSPLGIPSQREPCPV
jgi:hypothetical protein